LSEIATGHGATHRFPIQGSNSSKDAYPHSRGAIAPELCEKLSLLLTEGAGKAGYRLIPMAPVQQKSTGKEPLVQPEYPAFPAQWF
jgi:hypothetical protein